MVQTETFFAKVMLLMGVRLKPLDAYLYFIACFKTYTVKLGNKELIDIKDHFP